jgi:cytochrome c-type protein NapC
VNPIAVATGCALLFVLVLLLSAEQVASATAGRWLILVGVAIVPAFVAVAGLVSGVKESTHTDFCMSCHEMERYGQSLFVDNPKSLAAMHYQKRLITRDGTCYACHTDYAMYGDIKAKLNGLRHVWVHYLGDVPEKIKLYQSYPNYNCLHCHDDSRSYIDVSAHRRQSDELKTGRVSCLSCHRIAHDLDGVAAQNFWQAEGPAGAGVDQSPKTDTPPDGAQP